MCIVLVGVVKDLEPGAGTDLKLLVEAERRCLLDDATASLLSEARNRGVVARGVKPHHLSTKQIYCVDFSGSKALRGTWSKINGDFDSGRVTDAAERMFIP